MEAGAVQETVTCVLPDTPATEVGAPGTVAGVTAEDAVEATLVPMEFVAVAVKVYAVPFVRPETVQERGPVVQTHVALPGDAVTV